MSLCREENEAVKNRMKNEYGRCREEFERALVIYEALFKEWERTGDEETGMKSDEAYEKLQKVREYKKLLAEVWLERLIDDEII